MAGEYPTTILEITNDLRHLADWARGASPDTTAELVHHAYRVEGYALFKAFGSGNHSTAAFALENIEAAAMMDAIVMSEQGYSSSVTIDYLSLLLWLATALAKLFGTVAS